MTSNNSSTEGSFKKGKQAGPGVILNQAGLSPKHSPKPGPTPVLAQDDRSPERTLCRIDEWSLRSDINSSSSRDGSLQVKGAETTSQKEEEGAQKTAEGAVSDEVKGAEDAGAEAAEKAEEAEEAKEEREAARQRELAKRAIATRWAGHSTQVHLRVCRSRLSRPYAVCSSTARAILAATLSCSQFAIRLLAARASPGTPNCMLWKMLHQLGGSLAAGRRLRPRHTRQGLQGRRVFLDEYRRCGGVGRFARRTEAAVRRQGLL